ncbi:hypothetical protein IWX48DRAFT_347817 [Phyllosticta citricarpa]
MVPVEPEAGQPVRGTSESPVGFLVPAAHLDMPASRLALPRPCRRTAFPKTALAQGLRRIWNTRHCTLQYKAHCFQQLLCLLRCNPARDRLAASSLMDMTMCTQSEIHWLAGPRLSSRSLEGTHGQAPRHVPCSLDLLALDVAVAVAADRSRDHRLAWHFQPQRERLTILPGPRCRGDAGSIRILNVQRGMPTDWRRRRGRELTGRGSSLPTALRTSDRSAPQFCWFGRAAAGRVAASARATTASWLSKDFHDRLSASGRTDCQRRESHSIWSRAANALSHVTLSRKTLWHDVDVDGWFDAACSRRSKRSDASQSQSACYTSINDLTWPPTRAGRVGVVCTEQASLREPWAICRCARTAPALADLTMDPGTTCSYSC